MQQRTHEQGRQQAVADDAVRDVLDRPSGERGQKELATPVNERQHADLRVRSSAHSSHVSLRGSTISSPVTGPEESQ